MTSWFSHETTATKGSAVNAPVRGGRPTLDRLAPVDRARVLSPAFVELLRAQCRGEVRVEVLRCAEVAVDEPTARLLRVDPTDMRRPGGSIHCRTAALRADGDDRVVAYAESWLVMARLTASERCEVRLARRPLGDVLGVAAAPRELLHWSVGSDAPAVGGGLPWGSGVVRRTTRIRRGVLPIALVTEWWPRHDDPAPACDPPQRAAPPGGGVDGFPPR